MAGAPIESPGRAHDWGAVQREARPCNRYSRSQ
jgi:hypothetical protein